MSAQDPFYLVKEEIEDLVSYIPGTEIIGGSWFVIGSKMRARRPSRITADSCHASHDLAEPHFTKNCVVLAALSRQSHFRPSDNESYRGSFRRYKD